MEIALNPVVASSTHIITLVGAEGQPALLEKQIDNSACNKTFHIADNGVVGIGHSILNLFGSPTESCRKEEVLTTNDKYTLASLSLKNALNVNNDNANGSGFQKLIEQQTNKTKILQCNSSDLALQQKKKKDAAKTSDDLLAALNGTKNTSTNKLNKIKRTTSSNASTSLSSSSSPPSMSAPIVAIATLTTTNCSSASLTTGALVMSTNTVTSTVNGIKNGLQIPSDILDDLASRFIINVPDMELSNLIRICFQIELAHWFYLDFFCASASEQQHVDDSGKKKKLPSCGIKQFAIQLFQHIPFLREHLSSIDKILDDWKNYKLSVPTFGAILISEDLNFCLLVQSYFAKSSWGFPKGKVNENEDPVHCATREVFEETGYDITKLIVPNDYIEAVINYQYTRLYIVRDVSLNTQFSPRTRNEIKCCDWFPIDSLPVNKNDAISKAKLGINANSFFMIMPFVKRLKKWVHDKRSGVETRRKYSGEGGGNSSDSTNSPTTLMTTAALATAVAAAGGNNNCINQNHTITNSCSKKNKHQSNNSNDDKHNALKSSGGNTTNTGNSNGVSTAASSNNSNRSKRQRHKSMGDLDGIKLNNLSSNNCNSNNICKNSANIMTPAADSGETTKESNVNYGGESGNCKTVSSHKRNGSSVKLVAAGSSNNVQNSNHNSIVGCTTSKRQLFHSQSQNGSNQNGEKIVSSFDLIRKEKQQQLKAAAQAEKVAKAQRQQQQVQSNAGNYNGRVRAKSQGDKMCVQQNINRNHNTNTNNNGGNNKHRVQKQISMIIINSNATTNSSIHNNNTINNNNNTAVFSARAASNPSPSSCSGAELLAFAAEAAAASNLSSATNSAQKQRPASVSLHLATPPTPATGQAIQQLQRMASGTNLRILKRSTSYQQQSQQLQSKSNSMQRLQQQALFEQSQRLENDLQLRQAPQKFTPSFNSWTNFSFTKNFIANVFC
ncbi:uncharacterized protein LOC118738766 isoform X1 [Rhagoletis pomonella]|uniref:uncharacterized protein LOC118738766 isoform X1 n=1 Tax=Rhagoletis pomonella TaxID=28610 RepID=UPI00177E50B8|nr:uncharacterized protein LOC118738766 isoform X1 [Rhagoletis pomonella]XP_036325621.1 uncharacterized protein LOC118738766 isoform X1 [Rhagoletis pomonella]